MKKPMFALSAIAALTASSVPMHVSAADEEVVVYCSVDDNWCRIMADSFQRETGINVLMTRRSSGETYAQIRAESGQPRGDIWWGGTGDPHLQAAEEGVTVSYKSPKLDQLQDWAVRQAEASDYRTVGVYAGGLGFGFNSDLIRKDQPQCWADLLKSDLKDDIQVANPNSSGTAYTLLATLVQLFGEDEAFDYLTKLNGNINQYTQSGGAPIRAAGTGETAVGIVFMHDAVAQAAQGAPVVTVSPCEGTGYEIGSMSLIKDGPNPEAAKKWYDWALTADAQSLAIEANSYQVPSNKQAKTSPQAPKLSDIKLIDYDFKLYGSSDERTRLLKRWDNEIGSLL
ncbi:ABC transporter substrate-binding protein [uncultured Vibrio sp.]|uniref:ABC transporter substrate-binding protein n=1 Tax=uncultured Vibrio sp. TaxID=114054 RepID=UPI0025ED04E4|nr:ABC transporter substrate-binding protein [uncultured Vibrio sp.]